MLAIKLEKRFFPAKRADMFQLAIIIRLLALFVACVTEEIFVHSLEVGKPNSYGRLFQTLYSIFPSSGDPCGLACVLLGLGLSAFCPVYLQDNCFKN